MLRNMTVRLQEVDAKIGAPLVKLEMIVERKEKEEKTPVESIEREREVGRVWRKTSLAHTKAAGRAILGRNTCTAIS